MVEQSAVNRSVVGSSPTFGAIRPELVEWRMALSKRSASKGSSWNSPKKWRLSWRFIVYILRLSNAQLYIGSTGNLSCCLAKHRSGSGSRATALSAPLELARSAWRLRAFVVNLSSRLHTIATKNNSYRDKAGRSETNRVKSTTYNWDDPGTKRDKAGRTPSFLGQLEPMTPFPRIRIQGRACTWMCSPHR